MKDFNTLKEIHSEFGLSVRGLREKIKDGSLKANKIGNKYFVSKEDLTEFLTTDQSKGK